MIVLLNLLEMKNDFAIYSYGYEENNLDGRIKIILNKKIDYEIIKESQDARIGKKGTACAIYKLLKAAKNNDLKECMCFQS